MIPPPNEGAVRSALREQVITQPACEVLVDEFWVPVSNERADLAVIGGTLDGYEIKTGRDSLRRLSRQSAAYGRVFDFCTAVVDERHLSGACEMLPSWWGVWLISSEPNAAVRFDVVRQAEPNPSSDPQTLVRLLWRDEALEALQKISPVSDGAPRVELWEGLIDRASVADLRTVVRCALLARDPSKARVRNKRSLAV